MDKLIDSRFERVENALTKLIQSIASYNPSTTLAVDLVTADDELTLGLQTCQPCFTGLGLPPTDSLIVSTHQANYAKILSLREEANKLDSTICDAASLLINTRRALIVTSATTFPGDTNPVSYSELLSYARRISKFTLAPTDLHLGAPTLEVAEGAMTQETNTPKEGKSVPPTHGANTPAAVTNGADKDTQMAGMGVTITTDAGTPPLAQISQNTKAGMPEHLVQFLNYTGADQFVPWPTDDEIRRGALGKIKLLQDQGVDPATFDPAESAALEEQRKKMIEEEDQARGERQRVDEERRNQDAERRAIASSQAVGQSGGVTEKQKVFQLETFDDDESD